MHRGIWFFFMSIIRHFKEHLVGTLTLSTPQRMERARQIPLKAVINTQMATRSMLYHVCVALLPLIAPVRVHAQREIEFFYNIRLNKCSYEGSELDVNNLTANGGLCAYDRSIKRLYGCDVGQYYIPCSDVSLHVLTLMEVNAGLSIRHVRREQKPETIKYCVVIPLAQACLPSIMSVVSMLTTSSLVLPKFGVVCRGGYYCQRLHWPICEPQWW